MASDQELIEQLKKEQKEAGIEPKDESTPPGYGATKPMGRINRSIADSRTSLRHATGCGCGACPNK